MRGILLLSVAAFMALAACSAGAGSAPREAMESGAPFVIDAEPVRATEVTAVKSYRFDLPAIEVASGTEVLWTNEDDFPHNVHFVTGSDETYDLPIGESAAVAFDEAGDYYYECSIHPQQMRGKVIVTG